jgi:RNA polymerase sigma-70 factor (ECF subfamily)
MNRSSPSKVSTVIPPIIARVSTGYSELASQQEISAFLAEVERRAFKQAMYAVRDDEAALDVVQDAMLKLTEKYADKPPAELPMLFQRILQNTIHDHFRRQKVRSTWTVLLSAFGEKGEKDED